MLEGGLELGLGDVSGVTSFWVGSTGGVDEAETLVASGTTGLVGLAMVFFFLQKLQKSPKILQILVSLEKTGLEVSENLTSIRTPPVPPRLSVDALGSCNYVFFASLCSSSEISQVLTGL